MTDISKMAKQIEMDEDSVRDDNAGRGRLLDDLRAVPPSAVRDVFNRVYADDQSLGKSTVIDISNGLLVITNPFSNSKGDNQHAVVTPDTAPQAAPQEKKTLLQTAREIHDAMPWYERLLIGGGALYEVSQINGMIKDYIKSK